MGMDIKGLAPINEQGKYFRNNIWFWRPLAFYCEHVAPGLTNYEAWHFNDGAGLNNTGALALASFLHTELISGRTLAYQEKWIAEQQAEPDEECSLCKGTGTREDHFVTGPCNGCNGKGVRRPFMTMYPFEVQNVEEWTHFLLNCGGFEIW